MPGFKVAILTASDEGAAGRRADRSGKMIAESVEKAGWNVVAQEITPDERAIISEQFARVGRRRRGRPYRDHRRQRESVRAT